MLPDMTTSTVWDPIDPLGEALHYLRMSGVFYCKSEFTAPWGLAMPEMEGVLSFHLINSGRCRIEVEGSDPVWAQRGDLVLVPHGKGHLLLSDQGVHAAGLFDLPRKQLSDRYEVLVHGGSGEPTSMICGAVRFDHPAAIQLVNLLPGLIHVDASSSHMEWAQSMLHFMASEAKQMRPGGETVITRLADILVIQAIRSWIEEDPAAQRGWLGALQDSYIGKSISLIHRDPSRNWTVESLAYEAGLSRSAFSARFTSRVGESVMHYVTRWKMSVAETWLKEGEFSLAELADRIGYQSEAAFNRTFKRFIGVTPGKVKRGSIPAPA